MLGRCNDRKYRTEHRTCTRRPDQAKGRPKEKSADITGQSLVSVSITVTDQAAGLRNEPFEGSRPEHEQPEANKDRDRKFAKCILIDSKYLRYCAENDRYTGKGRYEAERYQ
jgi:hypothetical protein